MLVILNAIVQAYQQLTGELVSLCFYVHRPGFAKIIAILVLAFFTEAIIMPAVFRTFIGGSFQGF